ncbi:MAG: hypothetical protein M0Z76_07625 [Gammaproteobacteria bacterium]|nr:hypothetical protein [Gammaproteobacteria bacterium]
MTLGELLVYVDTHSGYRIVEADAGATVTRSLAGGHSEPFLGQIVAALAKAVGGGTDAVIDRATATTALGPIRLQAMRDDAPIAHLRTVERVVHAIDGAFNDEALANRR